MIQQEQLFLGLELGSTRIKAVLMDEGFEIIAQGGYDWENQLVDGVWTYSLEEVWTGIVSSYGKLADMFYQSYGETLTHLGGIGISAMMHGYLVFDANASQLTAFRTWRNTMTLEASHELSQLFGFHIPQRWSIAHLYQAMQNQETHVKDIATMTTLAGYVHEKLTGEKLLGIGDASGMFPIDSESKSYDKKMLAQFDAMLEKEACPYCLEDILPKVLCAGNNAGYLSEQGARLLDPSGALRPGIPFAAPEGDAGTGMIATNSICARKGNISVGTSIFAMVVLEQKLSRAYKEIDLVTTPSGKQVAMVHCNNCSNEINAWMQLFSELLSSMGHDGNLESLYETLFLKALEGDDHCGGLLLVNYLSGEHITGFESGVPLLLRTSNTELKLGNFMKAQINSIFASLKIGMKILEAEQVEIDSLLAHGGLLKTKAVVQSMMANALGISIEVMPTASEGGPFGAAVLASYLKHSNLSLEQYLEESVFKTVAKELVEPEEEAVEAYTAFLEEYKKALLVEQTAVKQWEK